MQDYLHFGPNQNIRRGQVRVQNAALMKICEGLRNTKSVLEHLLRGDSLLFQSKRRHFSPALLVHDRCTAVPIRIKDSRGRTHSLHNQRLKASSFIVFWRECIVDDLSLENKVVGDSRKGRTARHCPSLVVGPLAKERGGLEEGCALMNRVAGQV